MGANVSQENPIDSYLLRSLCEETLWRASHVRLLFAWYEHTCKGGSFTWKKWNKIMNPVNKIPLSFVSRAWHLALALGRNLDLSKNQPLATLFKAVKAVGGVELPVLRTSAAKAELTKEEMDRKLVEDEKKKLRARLASAGKASLDLKTAAEGKEEFDVRHAFESMSFEELVRFLRQVEKSGVAQQILWSFLLFEEDGHVFPGTLMSLGKVLVPALHELEGTDKIDGNTDHVVAAVNCVFENKTKLNADEWAFACGTTHQVFASRELVALVISGLGFFGLVNSRVERLHVSAANYSCQGRLWNGRVQFKVRVENGFLSLVPAAREKEVIGFTESHRLVETQVIPDSRRKSRFQVILATGEHFYFDAGSESSAKQWVNAIVTNVQPSNSSFRFDSFARRREDVRVKWYVDGKDYFADLLLVLRAAEEEILITDWSMSPEIFLERETGDPDARLDRCLIERAKAGVKVHIMLWWQSNMATQGTVNAHHVAKRFKDIANIFVVMHPTGTFPSKWSHHQKSVIVDRSIGFCGGIDLCFGRYDDRSHTLQDNCHLRTRFPGKDFYNPGISACDNLVMPWEEKLDRSRHPREPWHDIQVGANRGVAADLARNFVQRWNHHVMQSGLLLPPLAAVSEDATSANLLDRFAFWRANAHEVAAAQMCRSISKWSGNASTERSIYKAYQHAIATAEHFIYIENQFFISSHGPVQNQIAKFLVDRVCKAVSEKAKFLVVIVLPFHPEGSFESTATRILYRYCYNTIQFMKSELERAHPTVKFSDYFQFGSPIQHAKIEDRFFLQLIYVHSKLMIVDDRTVICGSANINDRSMLGDRDSELAMYIEGKRDMVIKMDGVDFEAASFAHSLRTSLWIEHLGLPPKFHHVVEDPLSDLAFEFWSGIASYNQHVLMPILDVTPADLFAIVADGVPAEVRRHRIVAPNLTHNDELKVIQELHQVELFSYPRTKKSLLKSARQRNTEDGGSDDSSDEAVAAQQTEEVEEDEEEEKKVGNVVEEEPLGRVVFSGWLEKQRVGAAHFDHLHCDLTDHSLRFRDSRHSNEIRLKVPLSGSMRVADWDGAAFGFSLADEVGVTYFAAESDKQKRKWIKNIRLILSALRKKNFKVASDDFAGVIRKGHLVDTAREFLQMDGVVPITRPEGKRSEIVSGLLTPREIELLGDLPAEDDDHKQHTEKEKEEEAVDGDEHGKGKEEHGKGKEELGQAVEQHHTKHDDDDESGLREKLHHGKEAVHHTVVAVGEHIHEAAHQAKVEADHLASKAKRFLKVFSHTSVEKRLDRLQGHLVEYPISYKPRISADIYAAAPADIFT